MTDSFSLIRVLLDKEAPDGDRDDAAVDLEWSEGAHVIQALAKVASDESEDLSLVESAAESLGGILARTMDPSEEILKGLTSHGREIVVEILKARGR